MQISFNRSSATIASPTNWMGEALFGDHMFQSLKRDNCLSNTLSPLSFNFLSVLFQSLKRDNCLSNSSLGHLPVLLVHVSIAQARQLPLQLYHSGNPNSSLVWSFNRSSATIASPTQEGSGLASASKRSFNRSSATIASPHYSCTS